MKTLVLSFVAALACAAAAPALSATERQFIGSEQDHSSVSAAAGDCERFYNTNFTSFGAQVSDQERREFDLFNIQQIKVTAGQEGSVSIRGWNRNSARLVVCRSAVARTKDEARRVLAAIQVTSANGRIAAAGPEINAKQAWWVNMILLVPRKANLDVQAANGGVAIRNMRGRVTAHASAGGISVAQSSGRYKISTDTGGITLDRVTGLVEATSRDGSIAFKVAGTEVPAIEARTDQGGHITCTLKGCDDGSYPAGRTSLRLGQGTPDVRLTTRRASIYIAPVTY